MKRLILVFSILLFVGIGAMGQTLLPANGSVTQADGTLDATTSYTYWTPQQERYYIHFQFNMDSVSGTAAETGGVFTLYGSLDGTDYKSISTTTYTAVDASSDTTVFNLGTTAYLYRYLKVTYTLTDTLQCGHTIRIGNDVAR